jgi:hypothetical protein
MGHGLADIDELRWRVTADLRRSKSGSFEFVVSYRYVGGAYYSCRSYTTSDMENGYFKISYMWVMKYCSRTPTRVDQILLMDPVAFEPAVVVSHT